MGARRYTSLPKMGMRPSRNSSLLLAATSICSSLKGRRPSQSSSLLRVDLQANNGATAGAAALQFAEVQGHAAIATLIRNRKQETPLLGSRVAINGLVAKPELNGRTGTVVSFNDDKGRYCVELDDNSSFMIKPCNLLPTVCSVALCSLLFSQTLPRLS